MPFLSLFLTDFLYWMMLSIDVNREVKFLTIIVVLSNSPFMSANIFFMCLVRCSHIECIDVYKHHMPSVDRSLCCYVMSFVHCYSLCFNVYLIYILLHLLSFHFYLNDIFFYAFILILSLPLNLKCVMYKQRTH